MYPSRARLPRVLVVGGGAAGLAAAARLGRRAQVVLLEARDRLGGRIDTRRDAALGLALEHGAEFVHGRPERTTALARRARARLREVPDRHLHRAGSRLADERDGFARAQELLALGGRDDEAIAAVLRRAARQRRAPGVAVELAQQLVRGFYLADPRTASSLALARMTRALDEVGGEEICRVDGGYARLLEPLERDLRRAGGEVRLSATLEELRWRPGHVEARGRGAAGGPLPPVHADCAIVTLPVTLLRGEHVRFRPALPEKRRAAGALAMGPIVKVLLRFRRAQWAEAGPRALAFLHVAGAAVPVFWTLAPLRAPVLVGWAGGPDAERLAGRREADVLRAALGAAARGLGRSPAALEEALDSGTVVDWTADPLARGGYAVFPAGAGDAPAALARPVERTLFFAGEATAGGLAGTVEGAVRSGERAAAEVLEAIGARAPGGSR
jgi:monoamine oxidase